MKDDLDSIVQNLRASMSPDGKKPGYAIVGTGMMGREHKGAITRRYTSIAYRSLAALPAQVLWVCSQPVGPKTLRHPFETNQRYNTNVLCLTS